MKERIITAIVLLAVIVPIIWLGGTWFWSLAFLATLTALQEMMTMRDQVSKVHFSFKLALFIAGGFALHLDAFANTMAVYLAYVIFSAVGRFVLKIMEGEDMIFYTSMFFDIVLPFWALVQLRNHSLALFLLPVVTVVLTDSAAYFTGMLFGKRKLAPKVSPKKTVEGAIGGWLFGAFFAFGYGWYMGFFTAGWILIATSVMLPVLGQIGDLIASWQKRRHGIKDFGKLFPGHGGVMDRVDSQMLVALFMYLVVYLGGVN